MNYELLKEKIFQGLISEISSHGYVPKEKAEEIIVEKARKYINSDSRRVLNVLWWIFVTPFYEAKISFNGEKDTSGIYHLEEEKINKEWRKYLPELKKRVKLLMT